MSRLRIVAGLYGGRTLNAPPGQGTRPTPDRVRESLFSMLGPRCEGARVADLFAGTGALGLEALSRGATSAVFVERDRRVMAVLRRNLESLQVNEVSRAIARPVGALKIALLPEAPFDLVFADPPYRLLEGEAERAGLSDGLGRLVRDGLLAPEGALALEHPRRVAALSIEGLTVDRRRDWGETSFVVYAPAT